MSILKCFKLLKSLFFVIFFSSCSNIINIRHMIDNNYYQKYYLHTTPLHSLDSTCDVNLPIPYDKYDIPYVIMYDLNGEKMDIIIPPDGFLDLCKKGCINN